MQVSSHRDGRRVRGDRTRRLVAHAASQSATVRGLDAITVGTLAASTGVSKSGILTVFESREAIQLAAVAHARELYREHVIGPAWRRPPGRERLHGWIEAWQDYLRARVFAGGCFVTTTSAEYGHRDGPVAEAVRKLKTEWLELLRDDLRIAGSADAETDAFKIDAYLSAAATRRELLGDDLILDRARALADEIIDVAGSAQPGPPSCEDESTTPPDAPRVRGSSSAPSGGM